MTGTVYIDLDSSAADAIGKSRTEILVEDGEDNEVEILSLIHI